MLKNVLIIVGSVVAIVAAGALYLYSQRDEIVENVAEYAAQNQPVKPAPVTSQSEEKKWDDASKKAASSKSQNTRGNNNARQGGGSRTGSKSGGSNLSSAVRPFTNNSATQSSLGNTAQKVSTFLGFGPIKSKANKENSNYNAKGQTLLMNLCRTGVDIKALDMVVKYGADINAKDNNGRTALMYAAAFNSNPEVIKYLLDHGADAKITDLQGKTALDYAANSEVAEMLKRALYK